MNNRTSPFLTLTCSVIVPMVVAGSAPSTLAGENRVEDPGAPQIAERALEVAERALEQIGPYRYLATPDASPLAWVESHLLKAIVSLAESTGEARYYDLARDHARRIFELRADRQGLTDEIRGRPIKAWTSGYYNEGKQHASMVHTAMITYPIARWCYLVNRDADLRARYGQDAATFVPQIIESLDEFDSEWREVRKFRLGYYANVTNPRFETRVYNGVTSMGRTYVMLWLLTGEERFRRRAEIIARYFKAALRLLGDAYDWPYWDMKPQESEDISHAAISVDFAFQCYRAGLVFDERDMKRFVGTLRRIYGGEAGYHEWINGTGEIGGKHTPQVGRWLRLGYLDSQVREDYARYLSARDETSLAKAEILGAAYLVETAAPLRFERPLPSLKEGKRYPSGPRASIAAPKREHKGHFGSDLPVGAESEKAIEARHTHPPKKSRCSLAPSSPILGSIWAQPRLSDLTTRLQGLAVAPDRPRWAYASPANVGRGAPPPALWAEAQLPEVLQVRETERVNLFPNGNR